MNVFALLVRVVHVTAALAALSVLPVAGGTATAIKTNLVDRWITNVIQVTIPANRFVNEYHTNWVQQVRTNVLDVYTTNHLVCAVTNRVVIDLVRTNFVAVYQTNLKTLHLTNWATVLIFKTNWVTHPITNVVEIELTKNAVPGTEDEIAKTSPGQKGTVAAVESAVARAASSNPLALEAKTEGPVTGKSPVEVRLSVKWTNNGNLSLQVQQWRIEREDGSILCFGQDREFKRALPVGKYKVEVKAQHEDGPLVAALGTLAVMPRDVVLQQQAASKN